jgi:hypothetical protein
MICTVHKYYSGNQIKKGEMGRTCGTCGGKIGAHRILVGRPDRKKSLGRPKHRWEDNNKMDLQLVA